MATEKKTDDAGQAEMQKTVDQLEEQGFIGDKVDQTPDEEYSLLTGPTSPPHVPDDRTRAGTPTPAKE